MSFKKPQCKDMKRLIKTPWFRIYTQKVNAVSCIATINTIYKDSCSSALRERGGFERVLAVRQRTRVRCSVLFESVTLLLCLYLDFLLELSEVHVCAHSGFAGAEPVLRLCLVAACAPSTRWRLCFLTAVSVSIHVNQDRGGMAVCYNPVSASELSGVRVTRRWVQL